MKVIVGGTIDMNNTEQSITVVWFKSESIDAFHLTWSFAMNMALAFLRSRFFSLVGLPFL
ncbi:hypothetical protein JL36_08595 [Lactococcus cremoris]|nr:hypothetical protein JL36_08595 [Lactococcus cremoris]